VAGWGGEENLFVAASFKREKKGLLGRRRGDLIVLGGKRAWPGKHDIAQGGPHLKKLRKEHASFKSAARSLGNAE